MRDKGFLASSCSKVANALGMGTALTEALLVDVQTVPSATTAARTSRKGPPMDAIYPAVKAKRTEDILLEALEEHLGIKRVIADARELTSIAEQMQATMQKLEAKGDPRKAVPAETRDAAPLK
jgi:hypothetical protein